uniref:C-factor n=1 Tax=Plectus sambesii TaxID=2011161 RepID=A0A914VKK8_9BILA
MHPRSVLVTGASRGIGLEMVRQLAAIQDGPVHIFAACRNPDAAEDLQILTKDYPQVHPVYLDVENDESIWSAADQIQAILKPTDEGLNLLINNAGICDKEGSGFSVPGAERGVFLHHLNVNSVGPVLVTQAFLPLLQKAAAISNSGKMGAHKAAIINISSILGSIAENALGSKLIPNIAYRMSKTALNQLTKTLAVDMKPDGILVASFCPGWVQTDMGGPQADLKVNESVSALLNSIEKLSDEHTGDYFHHNGETISY